MGIECMPDGERQQQHDAQRDPRRGIVVQQSSRTKVRGRRGLIHDVPSSFYLAVFHENSCKTSMSARKAFDIAQSAYSPMPI
jgi:hypothetical protein